MGRDLGLGWDGGVYFLEWGGEPMGLGAIKNADYSSHWSQGIKSEPEMSLELRGPGKDNRSSARMN